MTTQYITLRNLCKLTFVIAFLSGCSNAKLYLPEAERVVATNKGELCTLKPDNISRPTKFLFIIDLSGSNVMNGGTDPNNVKRADSVEKFYNDNINEPAYSWGILGFQEDAAKAYTNNMSDLFTKDQKIVRKGIDDLRGHDNGATPYKAAMLGAIQSVDSDIKANPQDDAYYMVFFLSDGGPTDLTGGISELKSLVEQLVGLKAGRVNISTAYYGPPDSIAEGNLQNMARYGNGNYLNLNNQNTTDFQKLVVKPSKEPYRIKNTKVMVYNLNSAFCEDGAVGVDSDGDGLCDRDEARYGLDSTNRFSATDNFDCGRTDLPAGRCTGSPRKDTQGYGDFFRWREIKFRGMTLPPCADRKDEDHDLLTTCEEAFVFNASPNGTTHQHGDPKNPDTDGDGIIDGIEVLALHDLAAPMDAEGATKSLDNEPEDVYTQISEHRNPNFYDPNAFRYDTQIHPTFINEDGQTCYSFQQAKLQLYSTAAVTAQNTLAELVHGANQNNILIYYIQTPQSDPKAKGVYVYSIQMLSSNPSFVSHPGLNIEDSIFKNYRVP